MPAETDDDPKMNFNPAEPTLDANPLPKETPVGIEQLLARDISTRRVLRRAPHIDMAEVQLPLMDSKNTVMRFFPGSPKDVRAKDVRSTQTLVMESRSAEVRTVFAYTDVVAVLEAQHKPNEKPLSPQYLQVFRAFVEAVDKAVPYDVRNLAHDVGAAEVCRACRLPSEIALNQRMTHRTAWTSEELMLLKIAYPKFDIEATCAVQLHWRVVLNHGVWSQLPAPDGMGKLAAERGLPTAPEWLPGFGNGRV